jgi:peptidoglycan/LPS O-acetylase OafA/YrhL
MSEAEAAQRPQKRHRFAFVDGLRGIAAVAVAGRHLLAETMPAVVPRSEAVVHWGGLGVEVFFVISGFVIAHSLGRASMSPAVAGRFLLRRMARLDPPYWASMALGLLVYGAASLVLRDHTVTLPSAGVLAAHVLYLQYILGIPSLSDVYWTLCLEIQFYLLLALLIGLKQRAETRMPERLAWVLVFGPPLLGSLLVACHVLPLPRGSCFEFWYAFAAGVAAQRLVTGRGAGALAVAVAVALLVWAVTRTPEGLVVAVTAALIGVGHVRGKLDVWLSSAPLQFLGRISYSLYLIHWTIGGHAANLAFHFVPATPGWRLATSVASLLLAIVAADLFWRAVERPSIDLGRWITIRMPEPARVTAAP